MSGVTDANDVTHANDATPATPAKDARDAKDVRIRPLGSGKYSDVFLVTWGNRSMAMRISYYRDDTVKRFTEHLRSGDKAEAARAKRSDAVAVASAFSSFVREHSDTVTPHFVMTYHDVDSKSFVDRFPLVTETRMKDLTPYQKRYNNVCFMEAFSCDLTRFLMRCKYDEATLRCVVFQVLYTVAAMQRLLPGWRHNDLSTNNVLVKKMAAPVSAAYIIAPTSTTVGARYHACVPVLVALNDWDFVHVPGHPKLENARVMGGRYRVDASPNKSYDVHFFLKWVLRCIAKKPRADFPETTEFLKRVGLRPQDRQDANIPSLAPMRVLQDRYFDVLKRPVPVDREYSIPTHRGK